MKKVFLFLCMILISVTLVHAQQIDKLVREAVNNLANKINTPLEVSIETIMLDGTETPSGFSRMLLTKVDHFATNNDLFRVIAKSRSLPTTRPGGAARGSISGNYTVTGDKVTVTLELVSDKNVRLSSQQFTLSLAELKKEGYDVLPENIKNTQEVKDREKIITVPPVTPANTPAVKTTTGNTALAIKAWPNSDTNTYIENEKIIINLQANMDCYVKVYHIDMNKKMQMIFPSVQMPNNFLSANNIRTIPEGGIIYNVTAPFGQDTIMVVAALKQFPNIETEYIQSRSVNATKETVLNASRGLGVEYIPSSQTVDTVSVSFNFTSLPGTYYDESFSYSKPANMAETVRSMREDVLKQGGTFNGDEKGGSYTVNGATGVYSVSGNTFTVKQRYTGGQLGSRTRGMGYNFTIDKPKNINNAIDAVRKGILSKGGEFKGDEKGGSFQASGIAGNYDVDDRVSIGISQKPAIIPNSMIEKEIKNYFTGK